MLKMIHASKNQKKSFHPISYTPLASKIISYASNTQFSTLPNDGRKRGLVIDDRTGMFKLSFSDGSCAIIAKWWEGAGQNAKIVSLMVAEHQVFYNYNKYASTFRRTAQRPKIGIFTAKTDGNGFMHYNKLKKIQHTPVVHPAVDEVTKDMDNYFANVKDFTRYGMSGVRKVLLVGPPGTGKSSYAYMIASRHKEIKSIVFADQINSVAQHLTRCCKSGIPTIIIWEDAESTGLRGAGSDILNFLDGIDQPQTTKGAYIMMTTNFPELIDKRIKKRPGRVDKIFEFGVLYNEHALECAQIYFEELFSHKFPPTTAEATAHFQGLADLVNGLSGAGIKSLAYSSKLYAASHNEDITLELIKKVKDGIDEDLAKVDKYGEAPEETLKAVGFGATHRQKRQADINWSQYLKDGF
jgi:DNA polymerase III delta prime subunit